LEATEKGKVNNLSHNKKAMGMISGKPFSQIRMGRKRKKDPVTRTSKIRAPSYKKEPDNLELYTKKKLGR